MEELLGFLGIYLVGIRVVIIIALIVNVSGMITMRQVLVLLSSCILSLIDYFHQSYEVVFVTVILRKLRYRGGSF